MRSYWLAPVLFEGDSVLLSSERFELTPRETGERFLQWVKSVHPQLLVPFKSNLLLSEEAEVRCGVDQLPFELESGEQIIFSPELLELSHCAQAYIDKRPIGAEIGKYASEGARSARFRDFGRTNCRLAAYDEEME